jgi:hypothetical protein
VACCGYGSVDVDVVDVDIGVVFLVLPATVVVGAL